MMNEEQYSNITPVIKTKDPKHIEGNKRLAAISKDV